MKYALAIFLVSFSLHTRGQVAADRNQVAEVNQRNMDSVKSELRGNFPNFRSTKVVSRKELRADKKVIAFLNKFYNNDASIDEIRNWLKPFFDFKWEFQVYDLGHAKKYDTRVKSEGNLDVHVSLATFDDQIVYKRIYFRTRTETLFDPAERIIVFPPDINYIDSFLIPHIRFPIEFCIRCPWVTCDTSYVNKLGVFKSREFQFFPDSSYLNYMTWFDNDVYMRDYAVRDICDIVKRNDTALLEKLLYSPNHILALYAVEALTYLTAIGSYYPSSVTSGKMKELIDSDIKIRWQTSDVGHAPTAYRQLGVVKEMIIYKFKAQLLHK